MKKAEISNTILKYNDEIPIITHLWNDFVLELRIQESKQADLVKKKLYIYCQDLLKGFTLVIKWEQGEKVIIF